MLCELREEFSFSSKPLRTSAAVLNAFAVVIFSNLSRISIDLFNSMTLEEVISVGVFILFAAIVVWGSILLGHRQKVKCRKHIANKRCANCAYDVRIRPDELQVRCSECGRNPLSLPFAPI